MVCHFPRGTSKWNKIEHRLFAHITMNWRGRPLTSHEVVVQTIAATTTRAGLTVHAELDRGSLPHRRQSVPAGEMDTLAMAPATTGTGTGTTPCHPSRPAPPPPAPSASSRLAPAAPAHRAPG